MSHAEYVFVTTAPLYEVDGRVTAYEASARIGSVAPARALGALGYDARAVSAFGNLAAGREAVRHAKRVVLGEMFKTAENGWRGPISAYRELLKETPNARERVIFGLADDHFADPEFASFYRAVLRDCLAVTVVSEGLAARMRELTSRPVIVAPEPVEGARGTPQAIATPKVSAPVAWLARRVGLSIDHWRVRLLWFGYPQNLPPLVDLVPALEEYAAKRPLLLTCVTSRAPEQLLRPEFLREESRLRVQFVQWSPLVMDSAIAASDLVLLPSEYRNPIKQAKSPNRLIAGLHGGRFVVAHPLAAYAPYAQFSWIGEDLIAGLDWAIRHPRDVVERIARGQAFIDRRHSADAVARFWLDVLDSKN